MMNLDTKIQKTISLSNTKHLTHTHKCLLRWSMLRYFG